MSPTTTTNTITEAINLHGVFFKRAVRKSLGSMKGVRIIAEEYPVRYLDGSSIDLVVEVAGKQRFILPVECKRAYAATKQWIFFEEPDKIAKVRYSFAGTDLQVHDHTALAGTEIKVAVEGIQVHSKGNQCIADPNPIWDVGFQVCRNAHGFLIEELKERKKNAVGATYRDFCSFPLVVTTAPIMFCNSAGQKVDISTGNHAGDADFTDVGWLILNFPFAPAGGVGVEHLMLQNDNYSSPEARSGRSKEGVIFVNATKLGQFVDWLMSWT